MANRIVVALELACLVPLTLGCVLLWMFFIPGSFSALACLLLLLYAVVLVAHVATFDIGRRFVQFGSGALKATEAMRWGWGVAGGLAFPLVLLLSYLSRVAADDHWRWTNGFDLFLWAGLFLIPLTHLGVLTRWGANQRLERP
jgi:hypothetical protein